MSLLLRECLVPPRGSPPPHTHTRTKHFVHRPGKAWGSRPALSETPRPRASTRAPHSPQPLAATTLRLGSKTSLKMTGCSLE